MPFEPTGGMPPAAAFRNPNRRGAELEPFPVDGAEVLPPGGGRPGDLTAEIPPAPRGDIDFVQSPEIMPVQGPSVRAPIGNDIAGAEGFFPGAMVPEEGALTQFASDQPFERRRFATGDRGEVERRAEIIREREAVLNNEFGFDDNNMAKQFLDRPGMRDKVRADSDANLAALRGEELSTTPPVQRPLSDTEMLDINLAPADLDMQTQAAPRQARGIADELAAPPDASVQAAIDRLTEMGFSPEEIDEILRSGD
jgi:hypothetical protein